MRRRKPKIPSPSGPSDGDYMVDDCDGVSRCFFGEKCHERAYEYANSCGKYVQVYRYVGWQMVAAIHPTDCKCEQCESTLKWQEKRKLKLEGKLP